MTPRRPRLSLGPDENIVALEQAGFSTEEGFQASLTDALKEHGKDVRFQVRATLGHKFTPSAWKVSPGQVDTVVFVSTPDAPVAPKTFERLSKLDAILESVGWELRLGALCKSAKSCRNVDLRASRVTEAALRRKGETHGSKEEDSTPA